MGLEERIQRLADELEVRNTIARLAHLADDGDLDEYIQIFTPDAVWEGASGFAARKGREDILSGARERRAGGTSGPGTHTRHVISTTAVRVDGDRASSESVFRYYTGSKRQARAAADGRLPRRVSPYLGRLEAGPASDREPLVGRGSRRFRRGEPKRFSAARGSRAGRRFPPGPRSRS